MLPLRDSIPGRTTPYVTVGLIVANFLVWFWELKNPGVTIHVFRDGYYPCALDGPCHLPPGFHALPWYESVFTGMSPKGIAIPARRFHRQNSQGFGLNAIAATVSPVIPNPGTIAVLARLSFARPAHALPATIPRKKKNSNHASVCGFPPNHCLLAAMYATKNGEYERGV